MHRWYGSRPVPRGKRYALRPSDWLVAYIPYCLLLRFYSFFSSHCGQSIAMNSCECGTTNTHSPSLFLTTTTTSSLFDAKPLCVDSVCWLRASLQSHQSLVNVSCLRAHPDRKRIFFTLWSKLSRYVAFGNRIRRAPIRRSGFRFVRPSLENWIYIICRRRLTHVCVYYYMVIIHVCCLHP